ncbi:MAG: Uncharacterised protein [Synechococcus sp. MIT S9220]|nr:MAG: Uncharacterised protein [Synechococcus sp. MIT S9220]
MRDVALAVGDFPGLNRGVVADLSSQITDHVLGGLLNALLDCTSSDLSDGHVRGDLLAVVHKQQRTAGDLDLLSLALAGGIDGELEISFSLLGVDPMGGAVRTHA